MLCDSPSNYEEEKECTDFIASIPTVWEQAKSFPYNEALVKAKLAMRYGTLKGILWHQGKAEYPSFYGILNIIFILSLNSYLHFIGRI
jgi:hypothetical protein